MDASPNETAFLAMLAHSEGTDQAPDPYRVCYARRHVIESFADHPAVTGEWLGEKLNFANPQYQGLISTAAGRYQIIKPTWIGCRTALELPDFSPASQDAAALYLIGRRDALEAVNNGHLQIAVSRCSPEWASLPGSQSGQPQRSFAALEDAFTDAGGILV